MTFCDALADDDQMALKAQVDDFLRTLPAGQPVEERVEKLREWIAGQPCVASVEVDPDLLASEPAIQRIRVTMTGQPATAPSRTLRIVLDPTNLRHQ